MDLVVHNAGVYEFGANADAQARMQQVNVVGTDIVLGAAPAGVSPEDAVRLVRGGVGVQRLCA
jgi:nucleoside-diphosphate-sugar epimerase